MKLSVLQPLDLWEQSGRAEMYGPDLFTPAGQAGASPGRCAYARGAADRHGQGHVNSYRDLPLILYQVHTKFRDEPRPRGGLIRVREFDMKDAYSFDRDQDGLDASYQAMAQAYRNIYARCGLSVIMVDADSGAIGGKESAEFILLADSGEDTILICERCGYAANAEKAKFAKSRLPMEEALPLEEVHTPGVKTIDELAALLDIPAGRTLKAVFYSGDGEMYFVTIRGDLEVNEVKLRNALGVNELRLATPAEVEARRARRGVGVAHRASGREGRVGRLRGPRLQLRRRRQQAGLSPAQRQPRTRLRVQHRDRHSPRGRRPPVPPVPLGPLPHAAASRSATSSKLGTRYTESSDTIYPDQDGNRHPIVMGCYGIGVGRLLAAAIEQHHDDKGIVYPDPIAPYSVLLTALNVGNEDVSKAAEALYARLREERVEVLYDDRTESAGVKFNDADLLGLPVRLVVSPRNVRQDIVEVKRRSESEAVTVPTGDAVAKVRDLLS